MAENTMVLDALEKLYVSSTKYGAPQCAYLRYDVGKHDWYCDYRNSRRDRYQDVCVYDDKTVENLRKIEQTCPCWHDDILDGDNDD